MKAIHLNCDIYYDVERFQVYESSTTHNFLTGESSVFILQHDSVAAVEERSTNLQT